MFTRVWAQVLPCAFSLVVANTAMAATDIPQTTALKREEIISTAKWHGVTFKCQIEEDDEIETTPGSPPLDVDDPATPGCNNWEINVVASGDLTRRGQSYELPLLDINYGVGDNLQMKFEVPNEVADKQNSAIGDSKLGLKFQFYGNDDSKMQMAIYPQVQLGKAGAITTLPFLIAKRIGRTALGNIMLTGNVGYNRSTRADTANFGSMAVGLGMALYKKTSLLGEIVTEQAFSKIEENPRAHLVKADIGLMGPVGKYFFLFGSVGHSIEISDRADHAYFVSGFRFLPGA